MREDELLTLPDHKVLIDTMISAGGVRTDGADGKLFLRFPVQTPKLPTQDFHQFSKFFKSVKNLH